MTIVRFKQAQVPEGTKTISGEGFRFCLIPRCDGEEWAEIPEDIDVMRAIKKSGARSHIEISRAVVAYLRGNR